MKFFKIVFILVLLSALIYFLLTACEWDFIKDLFSQASEASSTDSGTGQGTEPKLEDINKLKALLPPKDKELRYFGLAEYAHTVKMTEIERKDSEIVYLAKGSFEDGSGIPGEFTVKYTLDMKKGNVTESVTENTRSGENKVNSIIPDLIILRAPLAVGNSWQQVVEIEGSNYTVNAVIKKGEVTVRGTTSYLVKYNIEGIEDYFRETYIEERTFEEGLGMTAFSQLIKGDIGLSGKELEDETLVEEALANSMFGYGLDINSLSE